VSISWLLGLSGVEEKVMSLNDEIGNFSKRREATSVTQKNDYDEYEYDDDDNWDDEEYEDDEESPYGSFDFKMYNLDELDKYNAEVKELDELISPWWRNLRVIFTKATFGKIGLLEYKKRHLFKEDTFEEIEIENVNKSLTELSIFESTVKSSYNRRIMSIIYTMVFYLLLASWTGWSMVWYFLLGWSLWKMIAAYLKHRKEKAWFVKARTFITAQSGTTTNRENLEQKDTGLADIMAFNEAISKEENNHWSIKLYDAVANLFTRKK